MHRHHRRKGNREDNRPVNILLVDPEVHEWIEKHPAESYDLGWSVRRHENPEDVSVAIPKSLVGEPKPRAPRKKERPRNRATIQFRVPKDDLEDGAGLWDDLFEQCVEALSSDVEEGVNVGGKSTHYNVTMAVMYEFLTHRGRSTL